MFEFTTSATLILILVCPLKIFRVCKIKNSLVFSERISEKRPEHMSFGEQWESELDGVSFNFEQSDYVVAERLPVETSRESAGKSLAESDSDVS